MSDISNETIHTLTGYLGPEFQLKLMWQLLIEPEFAEKIISLLSVEYFDDPSMKKMFIIILQYFKDNEKVPNIPNQSINLAIQKYKSHNDPIEEELLLAIINKIKLWNERVLNKDLLNDGDVIQRETFLFIKQQEYRKFSEFIQEKVKTGGIKSKNIIVEVEEKIKKIEDIGNDEDFGSQILEEIDDVLKDEFRETIPTGIGFLDEITGGGLGKGETGIILSPSGFGKSTMLTKIANTGINEGKNILQIIFEDTVPQVKRKHYAIWSKVPLTQFKGKKEVIKEKITTYFNENKPGQLVIKRFIEDETTIPQLKQWIIRYQKKFGIKFDEIILDYLDCIESHKKTNDVNESEKLIIKSFMSMGAELDIPCWTAVQSGRCVEINTIINLKNIGNTKIKNIKINDEILTNVGYKKITNIFPIKKQDVYKIKLKSGKEIICSENHLFPLINNKLKSLKLGLTIGDKLLTK